MASSNRHWPSMFKSKPCNTHHQWQHDINQSSLLSTGCQKPPYTSVPGCEERSPEPKPRWNPKPEQIRILEAIFNSGMVNPPRDEIRKIRAQLQEYGQVGDANVFYWFQNRKSRSKHKQRHLQTTTRPQTRSPAATSATTNAMVPAVASPSSSSSSGSDKTLPPPSVGGLMNMIDMSTSPTGLVNQTYFQGGEPFFFQGPQGYCLSAAEWSSLVGLPEQGIGVYAGLWGELMGQEGCKSGEEEEAKMKVQLHHGGYVGTVATANTTSVAATTSVVAGATTVTGASVTSPINEIQGVGIGGAARSTVFINEVPFEVGMGPLNVREAFGEEAVLIHSSGNHVLTDDWGLTLHPLQHGASYYLV